MFMLLSLPPAALILWNYAKEALAVECMALWFSHPLSQREWFLQSRDGNQFIDLMKTQLGEIAFDEAWQVGSKRELRVISMELLEMFA